MKCAFISDIHIKNEGDEASQKLSNFFKHDVLKNCDYIYFLGDIFEYMVGEHPQYTEKYSEFFIGIARNLDLGKKVIFIEGNHDFHFEKVIKNYLKHHTQNPQNFSYRTNSLKLEVQEKKIMICHGYEVDFYNHYFKRWYAIYSSWWMKIFVSYFLPFQLIQKLGEIASKDSKRRGKKTFDYIKMKEKYLLGAKALIAEEKVDIVIGGHTHIKEFETFEDGTCYYNVGYPKRDGQFLYMDGLHFQMLTI